MASAGDFVLVGAMVVINYGADPQLYKDLTSDSTLLSVGPFPRAKETFRKMKVSEVLTEMEHDPRFQLRLEFGESVRLDYVRESSGHGGSIIVFGKLPDFPFEMARAGINGEVTAKIIFTPRSVTPEIQILNASHLEFAEAMTWALSKWELKKNESELPAPAKTTEFECRVVFKGSE